MCVFRFGSVRLCVLCIFHVDWLYLAFCFDVHFRNSMYLFCSAIGIVVVVVAVRLRLYVNSFLLTWWSTGWDGARAALCDVAGRKKSISHTPKRYIETQSTCVSLWAFICSFFSSCVLLFFHFLSLSHSLSILCSFDWNSFLFLLCFCVEISSHSTPIVLAFTVILACIANRLYSFIQLYTFD